MKFVLPQLKVNQNVWAIVEEILDPSALIVSFQGDLIRVQNMSQRKFRPGQRIQLKVAAIDPLSFQLIGHKKIFGIDINI